MHHEYGRLTLATVGLLLKLGMNLGIVILRSKDIPRFILSQCFGVLANVFRFIIGITWQSL